MIPKSTCNKSPGKIRLSGFDLEKDDKKSKNGLVFKVSKDSFVTSPINGMVVYANQFRSYGNLVIIENDEETGFCEKVLG